MHSILHRFHAYVFLLIAIVLPGFILACSNGTSPDPGGSSEKAITSFSFASIPKNGIVNEKEKTILTTVAGSTAVNSLAATFTTTGVSVKVGSVEQISGTTTNDFTGPVTYTVTAADGTSINYIASVDTGIVFAGGSRKDTSTGNWKAGYWKDGIWIQLSDNGQVKALVKSGSDIYAGGYQEENGLIIHEPGYWKNGTWVALAPISATKDAEVDTLFVSGADVYAGGYCKDNNSKMIPGYWKNSTWTALPRKYIINDSEVTCLYVSGSDVYAGGYDNDSVGYFTPGYWKTGTWVGLSRLSTNYDSEVKTLIVSGNDVYAGGYNADSNGHSVPGYWLNSSSSSTWVPLPKLSDTQSSGVSSLVISGTDVYAGGYSRNSDSVAVPGYWKNSTWVPVSQPTVGKDAYVLNLQILGNDIIAGGYSFDSSTLIAVPGYWRNNHWVQLPTNYEGMVFSLVVD